MASLSLDSVRGLDIGKKKGREVLSHPFFSGLNLQRLRLKKIRAPWIPGEDKDELADPRDVAKALLAQMN